jgi:hypothetical protein
MRELQVAPSIDFAEPTGAEHANDCECTNESASGRRRFDVL